MTADAAPHPPAVTACPRCGTQSAGEPWCPSCGLNLRRAAQQAASAPAGAAAPVRHGPSRGLVIGLTVGGLALGGAVAAALFLAFRSSDSGTPAPVAAATVVQTVAVTQPSAPATTPAAAPLPVVTAADMQNVLGQYESAYSSEDIQWLGSLFAPNFVRQNGNDAPQDRAAALETYQQQFSGLTDPQYRLSNVHYTPGRGEGTAGADYTIEHAGGTASGTIGFHFVVRGGNLLIDEIAVMPA